MMEKRMMDNGHKMSVLKGLIREMDDLIADENEDGEEGPELVIEIESAPMREKEAESGIEPPMPEEDDFSRRLARARKRAAMGA